MVTSTWSVVFLLSASAVLASDIVNYDIIEQSTSCKPVLLPEFNTICTTTSAQINNANKTNSTQFQHHQISKDKVTDKLNDVELSLQLRSLLGNVSPLPTLNAKGKCGEHSRAAHRALVNFQLWAMRLYDSSAKISSGILSGNVNQLGDFDQCLGVHHETNNGENIQGQYCLAYFEVTLKNSAANPTLAEVLKLAYSHHPLTSNVTDPGHRIPRYSNINWGICVPASCSASDIELGLQKTIEPLTSIPELAVKITVNQQMCYVEEEIIIDYPTLLCIILFSALVGIVLLATLIDSPISFATSQNVQKSRWQRTLLAFSLRSTCRQLLSYDTPSDDISSMHGVRFINAFGLIFCHKSMALFFEPSVNRTSMAERLNLPWTFLGRTAIIYTDTFILLSGALVAYSLVKELDRQKGRISFKSKYIARFLRILPNFVAIVLFCTYIMQLMGSGPQWNLVVKHYSDMCKNHMWKNFLFIHNFFGFETMCLTHTHQLGIDMQLYMFSPLAVYMLWKWPKPALAVLINIATLSTCLRYIVAYENQLSSVVYFGMSVKKCFDTTNLSYILPTHRATVYIMGILFGFYLRRYPNGVAKTMGATVIGWTVCAACTWYPWISQYTKSSMSYKYDVNDAARYNAFYPIVWGMFSISLILMTLEKRGGWIGSFLRWKGFVVFTRLSYAVYLTQFPIFFYNVGSRKHSGYSTIFELLNIAELGMILAASAVLTLFVDLPFQQVKKIWSANEKQPNVTEEPSVQKSVQDFSADTLCEDEVPTRSLRTSISHSTRVNSEDDQSNLTFRRVQSTRS